MRRRIAAEREEHAEEPGRLPLLRLADDGDGLMELLGRRLDDIAVIVLDAEQFRQALRDGPPEAAEIAIDGDDKISHFLTSSQPFRNLRRNARVRASFGWPKTSAGVPCSTM